VQDVATHAEISREHLTRIFVEKHGTAPAIFLRQLRLDAAQQLLQSAKLPLSEIALRSGFLNARQLGKWLRLDP
jgi:transcriptional regulator GlxA family with amidase domain